MVSVPIAIPLKHKNKQLPKNYPVKYADILSA